MQSPLFANGRMGGCPQKTATKIATNWCMNRIKTFIYRGFSGFTNLHGVQEAVSSTLATRTKAISLSTGGFLLLYRGFPVFMRVCGLFTSLYAILILFHYFFFVFIFFQKSVD